MNLIRSGSYVFISNITTAIIGIFAIVILTRITSPAALGAYFLFQALMGLIALPVSLGVNGAAEKRISEGSKTSAVVSTAGILKLCSYTIAIVVLFILRDLINAYIGETWATLLILAVGSRELSRLILFSLRAKFKMTAFAALQFVKQLLWATLGIAGILFNLGTVALVYALIISHIIVFVVGSLFLPLRLTSPSLTTASSLFKYARHDLFTSVGNYVYNWMDTAILGIFVAPGLVAAYEVAWRVTKLVPTILKSISTSTFPQISEWASKGKTNQAGRVVSQSLVPSLILSIPGFFGLLVLATETLGLVYGSEYTIASTALVVLMVGQIIWSAEDIFRRAVHAVDRPDLAVRAMLIAALLNLALNFTLIPIFGLVGAAFATVLALGVQALINYTYLRTLLPIDLPVSETGWSFVSAAIMGCFVYGITQIISVKSMLVFLVTVLFGACLYFIILSLHSSIRERINFIRNRILST